MDTLFIDRAHTSLETEAGRLLIRMPDARPTSLPLRQLRMVVLSSRVELSTTVLTAFHHHGISLAIIQPMRGEGMLVCGGPEHGNSQRRVSQVGWYLDAPRRLAAARAVVALKFRDHYRCLIRHLRRRPDLRLPIRAALQRIRHCWKALATATTIDQLLGLEGAAAAAYFAALAAIVPPSLGFTGRKRRPPPDPVNALLSLTYTLIHGEAVHALLAKGLDPDVGALHDLAYFRQSLACDLVETVRATCDAWIVDLLRLRTLEERHFQQPHPDQCLLSKEGRAIFYPLYQQASRPWRQQLRSTAANWAARLAPNNQEVHHGQPATGQTQPTD
jgi:CRISPR-associated protein Cas1